VKDNIAPCFFNYEVHREDLISALDKAESMASCPVHFIPGETALVSIVQEAGWPQVQSNIFAGPVRIQCETVQWSDIYVIILIFFTRSTGEIVSLFF
jgi:hypothetical protein